MVRLYRRGKFTDLAHTIFDGKFRKKGDVFCPRVLDQAKDLFSRIIPESSPRDLGREATIDPGFSVPMRPISTRMIYRTFTLFIVHPALYITILLDGARVEEPQGEKWAQARIGAHQAARQCNQSIYIAWEGCLFKSKRRPVQHLHEIISS